MRVLVDSEIYRLQAKGGISRTFTETLQRVGHIAPDVEIRLTFLENHFNSRLPKGPHITPPLRFRPRRLEAAVNLAVQKRWRPDIVHSSYFTAPDIPGARRVEMIYDFIYEEFSALMGTHHGIRSRKRAALEAADCIIAISNTTREKTLRLIPGKENKVWVIYPAVSEAFLAPSGDTWQASAELQAARGNQRPYWLFVGNRGEYKNFGTLLRAFGRIASRVEADLVLVGGEYQLEDWQIDLLISSGGERRVHLLGPVDDRLLMAAYRDALAFIFPSCAEGFGIPLLEAMACGTPVLAADIPVFREIAGGHAAFFDPHDQEALEELLLASFNAKPNRQRLDAAQRHASGFTWNEAARRMAAVYRACLAA